MDWQTIRPILIWGVVYLGPVLGAIVGAATARRLLTAELGPAVGVGCLVEFCLFAFLFGSGLVLAWHIPDAAGRALLWIAFVVPVLAGAVVSFLLARRTNED